MDIRFDGQVALVTGAGTGIGRATAIQFARSGAAVVVNYHVSQAEAEAAVQEICTAGGQAVAVQADVTLADDVNRLIQETRQAFGGRIDILVNNAGSLLQRTKIEDMTADLWQRSMRLNLDSVLLCSQAVLPIMKAQQYGRIINLASVAGRTGGSVAVGHYSSAKAAVTCFTKNLAKELAQSGITVNAVAPGVISTPFHDKLTEPALRKTFLSGIPLGREGMPEEVAYVILFLASRQASYILGETIEVNGGQLMD